MLSFSIMIGVGALLGHGYIYLRLVRRLVEGRRLRRAILGVLVAMTVLLVMRGPLRSLGASRLYEWVGYPWLGLMMCMTVAVAAGDLILAAMAIVQRLAKRDDPAPAESPAPEPDVMRRRVLKVVPWGVLAGGGLTTAYGAYRAFTAPELTEVPIPIAKLPPTLEGMSVVQLTDLHVGSFIGRKFVQMLVDSANEKKPDLVVITGDLVDGAVPELGDAVAALAGLQSRFGTFFVTGNHEYYSGDLAWTAFLERLGIRVLRNERATIGDAGGSFDLIGVDDWSGGRRRRSSDYDLDAALDGREPERAAILLAHQPANFDVAAARGIDLQISGHTHGGQLFPMSHLVAIRHPYHRGLYRRGDSRLYVSRGCGFWGPPSRVDSPPELVKYILTKSG